MPGRADTDDGPPSLDPKYLARICAGLDRAYEKADEEMVGADALRLVVFSDHHKGAGDRADDFRRSEWAYATALGYYLERGYRLFVLGDAEELWEEPPEKVVARYRDVLALEGEFLARGGCDRFWGNHDDLWAGDRQVRRYLGDALPGVRMHEGLRLRVRRPDRPDGVLFFVHGHQGTTASDRWGWVARLVVRLIWRRVQRWTGWSATTPATDFNLRARHDRAMFEWARARKKGVVLITGHTHRPVFATSTPDPPPARSIAELSELIDEARASGDAALIAALRAELEFARTVVRRPDRVTTVSPPCYFNTGCCSFPDGDVTGIEIADGEIRLVRWPVDIAELKRRPAGGVDPDAPPDAGRRVLAAQPLDAVLDAVLEPAGDARIEHETVSDQPDASRAASRMART